MSRFDTRELHQKRMALWNSSMENHKRYIDEMTGRFADSYMERRSCPVCGADDSFELFQKSGGIYCRCAPCGMIFLNPAMRDAHLNDYYRNNHDVQSATVRSDTDFYSSLYNKGLDLAEEVLSANGCEKRREVLDIGCSAGGFLDNARKRGYRASGLELNTEEAALCRNAGHDVAEATIAELDGNRTFDLITLWDVFEHIKDGRSLLLDARKHLTEDGVIFIQSPSQDSLAARALHEKCNMFDGLEHVNIYGHSHMLRMAEQCGLRVALFQTVIPEAGVLANHLDYQDPYLGVADDDVLKRMGLGVDVILRANLGYKFQVVLARTP